jgi:PEP-CTERM motif
MFRKSCFLFLIMAVSICLGAVAANAQVTFFDSTGSTYRGSYSAFGTEDANTGRAVAGEFTSASSGSVTDMWLEIDWRGIGTTSRYFTAQIWSVDNSGSLAVPGTMLWSSSQQTASHVYGPASNPLDTLQDVSVSGLSLTAAQQYFAVVVGSDSGTPTATFGSDVVWYQSSTLTGLTDKLLSGTWQNYTNTSGNYVPGFKILGATPTGVPEPITTLLLGFGLVGLAGAKRKFKK